MVDKKIIEETCELLKACNHSDTECGHMEADDTLCNLLKRLGYGEVVTEFRKVRKWYA